MENPYTSIDHLSSDSLDKQFIGEQSAYLNRLLNDYHNLKQGYNQIQVEKALKEQQCNDLQLENKELQAKIKQQEEEIQRLRKEKTQQETDDQEGCLYLAKFKGAIIILLYILYAITRLKKPLLLTHSGTPATFKEVVAFFSKALHVDLKNASQRISSALVESDNLNNHLAVFKEMMEIITDRYNRR